MGIIKDFDIRIRNGGDDAVGAVNELMAELQRRLLELQASMPRWIPVTERLPDEEQEVLAYWPPEDHQCGRWMSVAWVFEGDKWKDMEMELKSPTHWMPLPAPPTDAK